jgi:predicted metalloprotease with PDZ domain
VQAACNFEAGHEYRIKTTTFIDEGDFMEIVDVNTGFTIFSNKWIYCKDLRKADEKPVGTIGIGASKELTVTLVAHDSPAEKAGVKVGDKLKSVDGIQVKNVQELHATVPPQKVGEKRTFVFERDGKEFAADMVGEPLSKFHER